MPRRETIIMCMRRWCAVQIELFYNNNEIFCVLLYEHSANIKVFSIIILYKTLNERVSMLLKISIIYSTGFSKFDGQILTVQCGYVFEAAAVKKKIKIKTTEALPSPSTESATDR